MTPLGLENISGLTDVFGPGDTSQDGSLNISQVSMGSLGSGSTTISKICAKVGISILDPPKDTDNKDKEKEEEDKHEEEKEDPPT
jgi:hypothetical protein